MMELAIMVAAACVTACVMAIAFAWVRVAELDRATRVYEAEREYQAHKDRLEERRRARFSASFSGIHADDNILPFPGGDAA